MDNSVHMAEITGNFTLQSTPLESAQKQQNLYTSK